MPKPIEVRIAAHPIQVKLAQLVAGHGIDNDGIDGMTLREMAKRIGMPNESPQKIRHHLGQLVKYGFMDIVGGKYRLGKALNE
jgi:DNA-binding IclR family transcriptional regulator